MASLHHEGRGGGLAGLKDRLARAVGREAHAADHDALQQHGVRQVAHAVETTASDSVLHHIMYCMILCYIILCCIILYYTIL